MAAYEHILVEREDGVAILTMNRPEVLNAMNSRLTTELQDAVKQAAGDDDPLAWPWIDWAAMVW